MNPKVSIVMPTYNGAKYIAQSIDSCLNQTHANIQLTIIDDASTDNTPSIVNSYRDERIQYVRHCRNTGIPEALNTGFAEANGEYLTWTSDDNYYAANAVEKMLLFLKTEQCHFAYSDFYRFREENPTVLIPVNLPQVPVLEDRNCIGPCFLYSRNVKETVGDYDPDTLLAEDYDYWLRVSKRFSLRHFPEPLYYYREHAESLTASRYLEVRTIDTLVRLKNNAVDVDQATSILVELTSRKYPSCFGANKIWTTVLFSGKIRRILEDLKAGKSSFRETRTTLKVILSRDALIARDAAVFRTFRHLRSQLTERRDRQACRIGMPQKE